MRRILGSVLLLAVALLAAGGYELHALLETPALAPAAPIRIDVRPGEPFRATAAKLEEAGLVRSARVLTLWAKWRGIDREVQHGAYEFRDALSPIALVEKMRSGEAMMVRVTLPEGITARDVAVTLERVGLGAEADYASLIRDPAFTRSLDVAADSLEGYLFPDTYLFSPLDDSRKVLATLVGRFHQVVGPEMLAEAHARGLTLHELVTLASVVEKETGRPQERPQVAAVFLNRLRIGMPLQADPTVIYGIEHFDGNLTRHDLATPTPYNTYTVRGLPPGPIANPGRDSLLAVLHPAEVRYLYFVARDDGSHEFSTNLADHHRAVNRYQRVKRPAAGTG